ncbi:hypothetical protein NMY22_g14337 [Coprinellus aureogranulatus]|nr:hypothetical protein NMY22_g14337 [Coprinellus aureogranulatus]
MDGFVFLAPLAIVGYAGAVLALGIIIRYSGSQKLPIQLETVSGSSSSLPSPASSSSSSLKSTILRGVKSTTSTLKVAVRIPMQAVPRWSSLTELIAKRWRKRIMLEQLPTIASEDDNLVPPAPATPEPVLVDLTEASTVSSPFLPLRVLGTAAPTVRSQTPLLPTSASNVLATSRSSIFTLDSYSVPSTPPPYRGHGHQHAGHRYEAVSPFASPRSHASRIQEPGTYAPRSASPIVGLPHPRPRTPSPIYNNPHFLATSPVLRNHRRTRSFGGISVKRVAAAPAIPVNLPRNGSGTFVAGSFGQYDVEMKPFLHRPLSSRSTELLIDLEDGLSSAEAPSHFDAFEGVVEDLQARERKESDSGKSLHQASPVEESPLLLHSPVAVRAFDFHPSAPEPQRTATNNSWRQWETEDHDLLSMDSDYDLARFNTFEASMQQPIDPFSDLFGEPSSAGNALEDSFVEVSSPAGPLPKVNVAEAKVSSCDKSEPPTPSQIPTPPASPPYSLLRMPSTSSYPVTPVEIPGQSDDENGPSAIGEGSNAGLDLQEDWEEVSREEEDSKDDGASEDQELDSREAAVTVEENVQETVVDETEDCAEALSCDDPPLPDLPLLDAEESGQEDTALVENDGEGEMASDFSCADPPLPEIEAVVSSPDKDDCSDAQLDREDEVGDVATELTAEPTVSSVLESPSDEKERPAWSVRASEAPRLGLSTEQEPAVVEKRASSTEDSPEDKPAAAIAAPEPIARSNSIPGAFPALFEAEADPGTYRCCYVPREGRKRNYKR